ncbi:MAG: hypothetical protein BJ554DRAFT_281 [Olpidium bornovanus]|uniref:Uncharacterized protein n=1 Tax=Olpidium bornovanus TaxID=278681 RepID=A0A8H7ZTI4_9FUNG|nr:MAG: hypothetical protein BJ554DRAFT_281 [Olpidium bornovanus]
MQQQQQQQKQRKKAGAAAAASKKQLSARQQMQADIEEHSKKICYSDWYHGEITPTPYPTLSSLCPPPLPTHIRTLEK